MSILVMVAGLLAVAAPAHAATLTVNSTADLGDGICSPSPGECTLREAITQANVTPGADMIAFDLPGPPYTIQPTSPLPPVSDQVVIDGTTQPGFSGTPVVELDGSKLTAGGGNGLEISAANSTVQGLTVNRFPFAGILLSGASADGNLVKGNFIGTDTTGGQAAGNGVGVRIDLGSQNNTVGGTTASARNVISGNTNDGVYILGDPSSANATSGNVVQGNYIGTDVTGSTSLGNSSQGVHIEDSDNNTVGGTSSGAGNVLSGNGAGGQFGLVIEGPSASGNVAQGNYIGVKASGTGPLANGRGVLIQSSPDNTIGGTTAQARNVISGNTSDGLTIVNGTATGNQVEGNNIGVDAAGALGNGGQGVLIFGNASDNTVGGTVAGASNTIAYNGKDGISVGNDLGPTNPAGTGNSILGNSIFSNGQLGIDLVPSSGVTPNDDGDADAGSNGSQNFPQLTSAQTGSGGITVDGTLNSTPSRQFRLEFYADVNCDPSSYGEGSRFLGSSTETTDIRGNVTFSRNLNAFAEGGFVTATATDTTTNDTSEFSQCVPVDSSPASPPSPPTGVTAGAGDGQVEVSWVPPDSNGGSPIDSYTVTSTPGSPQSPKTVPSGSGATTTIGGLTNGTSYSFTVTATNQTGESDPSTPSESVIPKSGAPSPETATGDFAPGGRQSTGGSASASDPTNTTVDTPNGGTVSIGESVMSGNPPPGVSYFGQQVDITAPDATASKPLMLTFIQDCSVLPAGLSTCPTSLAGPTTLAAPMAPVGSAATAAPSVVVTDNAYTPRTVTVGQGNAVQWLFRGSSSHSVTDSRRLGPSGRPWFDSGSKPAGTTYSHAFPAAGGYPYHSTVGGDPPTMTGTVQVPLKVSQSFGNPRTTILITWASSRPTGYRFDVQYRYKPLGSRTYGSWVNWRTNTTQRAGQLIAEYLRGEGNYEFRARLENASTLRSSLWSPASTVTISSANRKLLNSVSMFREEGGNNARVPDCIGPFAVAEPTPACTWSEEILPDGDLKIVVFTTTASRWRTGAQ